MTDFEGVVPTLAAALTERGYETLTPVQIAVLADELTGKDLLVSAQTGSGKTVAFGLAMAPTLLGDSDRFSHAATPLALAVAPTRELALQVKRELEWLYAGTGASVASCVGGMDMRAERRTLERGVHIVVGTPGRLRDHIERRSLNMSDLRGVVLDEADEMLDLGFRDDLEFILGAAPESRRTLMFSATVPRTIASLATRYQRDAVRISTTAEREQHLDIDYRAMSVANNDEENAIINVLRYFDAKNALVFCATRAAVNRMTSRFANRGFSVVALSGELSQNERTHALQSLRDGRARVCVATDVAARGLDLPNLELVVHAEIPKNRESLLHRSGRTGRAGRKGVCALIVPHKERRRTERLLERANITASWENPPSADDIQRRDREKMLEDPSLTAPLSDEETVFVSELLTRHTPEQIAAAFLRMHGAGQSAPEELRDPEIREPNKKRREDFSDGVWFSLSVGRNQNAEPRWLLPMLCRMGQLTSTEIGSIKLHPDETQFEIAPAGVDRFLEAIGPDRMLEKNISVTKLEGPPRSTGRPERGGGSYEKKPYEKKPYVKKNYDGLSRKDGTAAPKSAAAPKPDDAPKPYDKPKRKTADTKQGEFRYDDAKPVKFGKGSGAKGKPKRTYGKRDNTAPGGRPAYEAKSKGPAKPAAAKPKPPRGEPKKLVLSDKPDDKPAYKYDQQSVTKRGKDGDPEEGGFAVMKRKKATQHQEAIASCHGGA